MHLTLPVTVLLLAAPQTTPLTVGSPAPAMTADLFVKGAEIKTFERGTVYVVEMWATWCGPCVASMPHLTELQKKFPDVRFVGVAGFERGKDAAENEQRVRDFVSKKGDEIGFTIAFDGDGSMGTQWLQAAKRNGIPCAFIVGKDGLVSYIGSPRAEFDTALEKATQVSYSQTTVTSESKSSSTERSTAPRATESEPVPAVPPAPSGAPEPEGKTVKVTEEPTDQPGTSSSSSVATSSRQVKVNGVGSTETITTETKVEVRDGRRKTTVTRTVTRSAS